MRRFILSTCVAYLLGAITFAGTIAIELSGPDTVEAQRRRRPRGARRRPRRQRHPREQAQPEESDEGDEGAEGAEQDQGTPQPVASPGSGGNVGVADFRGPSGGRVRGAAVDALRENGVEAVSVAGDLRSANDYVNAARQVGVNAIVEGRMSKRGRRWSARVSVHNAQDGAELGSASFAGRNASDVAASVRSGLWGRLGEAVQSGSPAPPEEAEPAETEEPAERPEAAEHEEQEEQEAEEEEEEDTGSAMGAVPLDIALYTRIYHRTLDYNDDLFGNLRPYSLGIGPAVALSLDWFPAAHFTGGFAANIGLTAEFEYSFMLKSSDSSGTEYPTSSLGYLLGLKLRVPLGTSEITGMVGYGHHSFEIEGVEDAGVYVPSVSYNFVRIGLGARFALTDWLAVIPSLGYRIVLEAGEIQEQSYFPRSDVGGLDVGALAALRIASGIEVRAGLEYRRYFYTMNPEPGDLWIAGGALDEYIGVVLGIAYRLEPSVEAEAAPAAPAAQ